MEANVGSIVHFSIPVKDLNMSAKFYGELFGWKFQKFSETYLMVDGQMGALSQEKELPANRVMPIMYFKVDKIDDGIARAQKLGAQIVTPKTEIGGGHGFFSDILDENGNVIGLWSLS